jgi:uncharacterized protein
MFDTSLFVSPGVLLSGAATGLIFGFLLQKARVTRAEVIIAQFLLRDYTVLKVILTAIVVGSLGIYGMLEMGMITSLSIKSAALYANILGGLIFGVGMAILGYCPGTALAAIGDGSRDAIAGVLGGLTGAALYAEAYPFLKSRLIDILNMGAVSLPDITGISAWLWIGLLAGILVLIIRLRLPAMQDKAGA